MISVPQWRDFRLVGRDLSLAGLVSSHGGNLSVRHGDSLVVTVHGAMLGHLTRGSFARRRLRDGQRLAGGEPSLDAERHRAIYQATGAGAVVHAHPRHAVALSLRLERLVPRDAEGMLLLKEVPVVGSGAEEIAHTLHTCPIVLVRGHGSYARGADLRQALQWTSVLEESAQILSLTR